MITPTKKLPALRQVRVIIGRTARYKKKLTAVICKAAFRAKEISKPGNPTIIYGDIVILLDKRELFRKQEKIDLSFIEFEILHLLMRSPGRVFSKEQIYDIIWNEPYSGDYNVVMRHICNIREKIEDDPGQPMYIQTVRGVGYRFNGNLGSK